MWRCNRRVALTVCALLLLLVWRVLAQVPQPPTNVAINAQLALPQIIGLSSSSGPVGQTVIIHGVNFGQIQGTSTVKFNGTTATVSVWSLDTLTTTVPVGATTGAVVVTIDGHASNGSTFTITAPPAPVVTIVAPTGAPTFDAGTAATVTVTGSSTGTISGCAWVNSLGGSGAAPFASGNWNAGSVPLTVGTNVITVTCTDTISQTGNDVITVTRTSNVTTVTITAPTSATTYDAGTAATLTTLAGTAASASGITGCTWSNDLGGSGSAIGTTAWSVASIALTVGPNVITVTCTSGSAVMGSDVLTVTRSGSVGTSGTLCGDAVTSGTILYVRPSFATGTHTGADWTNALNGLPATMVRDRVYCLAGGAYGAYTFNTTNSGTTRITVAKATATDHGTATGYVSTIGTTQAVFTGNAPCGGTWNILNDYLTLDGQERPTDWYTGNLTGYGIKIIGGDKTINIGENFCVGPRTGDNWTIRNVDLVGGGRDTGNGDDIIYHNGSGTPINITIEYSALHDTDRTIFLWRGVWTNFLAQYNFIARNTSRPTTCGGHSEMVSFTDVSNATFRYNVIQDIEGTAVWAGINDGVANGLYIYGNTIDITQNWWNDVGRSLCGGQAHTPGIGSVVGIYNDASNNNFGANVKFYNNTIYHTATGGQNSGITIQQTTVGGNEVFNNLWCDSQNTEHNVAGGTLGFNAYFNTGSNGDGSASKTSTGSSCSTVMVSPTGSNFHLTTATSAGTTFASPYNTDRDGVVRGADGTWDRGAWEKP